MSLPVSERVANGVAWLDTAYPTWVYGVSIQDLDMADECRCVLGQVFEQPREGSLFPDGFSYVMNYAMPADAEPDVWAVSHGFDCNGERDDFEALQAEWTQVIEARRVARTQPALV